MTPGQIKYQIETTSTYNKTKTKIVNMRESNRNNLNLSKFRPRFLSDNDHSNMNCSSMTDSQSDHSSNGLRKGHTTLKHKIAAQIVSSDHIEEIKVPLMTFSDGFKVKRPVKSRFLSTKRTDLVVEPIAENQNKRSAFSPHRVEAKPIRVEEQDKAKSIFVPLSNLPSPTKQMVSRMKRLKDTTMNRSVFSPEKVARTDKQKMQIASMFMNHKQVLRATQRRVLSPTPIINNRYYN